MTHDLTTHRRHRSPLRGLLRAMRPRQWAKNVLVFVAPGAAGVLTTSLGLRQALLGFVIFSMASAGTYLINDVLDVESDRRHPTKRNRPIASGEVSIPVALGAAGTLTVAALLLALWRTPQFALIVGLYVILTTTYSTWLKQQPVLDLVGLAAGFILRLLGGARATDVPISDWFLIISCFGALFIATGKRQAERRELGESASEVRTTLAVYTDQYLNFLKGVSAAAVLMSYCLFAVQRGHEEPAVALWVLLSIIPFLIAVLRYALLVEQGKGAAPEEVVLGDRMLQLMGLLWAVLMGISVYAT